jgi:ABC transporter substrate binding protein
MGLKEADYVEGEDVAIEHRWAENQLDRMPALAADLAGRRVAVIVASSSAAAFAAKNATATVPIVFVVPEDPVRHGLVASLARPGGNLTGINWFATEVTAKRLELLRDMVPATTRFALLVEPNNPTITEPTVRDVEAAARAMGLQMRILHANTSREIDAVFATFVHDRPDALFVGPGAFSTHAVCNWRTGRRAIGHQHADAPHPLTLLRARRERPRGRRPAEERYELAPLDWCDHSITSSAATSSLSGTVRPSILAVWLLMTSSNLVDCTTGRSAGLAPLRIRPT